jgi:hypothetical protein
MMGSRRPAAPPPTGPRTARRSSTVAMRAASRAPTTKPVVVRTMAQHRRPTMQRPRRLHPPQRPVTKTTSADTEQVMADIQDIAKRTLIPRYRVCNARPDYACILSKLLEPLLLVCHWPRGGGAADRLIAAIGTGRLLAAGRRRRGRIEVTARSPAAAAPAAAVVPGQPMHRAGQRGGSSPAPHRTQPSSCRGHTASATLSTRRRACSRLSRT